MVGLVDIGLNHNKKNQQTSQHIIHKKVPMSTSRICVSIRANELNSNIQFCSYQVHGQTPNNNSASPNLIPT